MKIVPKTTTGAKSLGFLALAGLVGSLALPTQPVAQNFSPAIKKVIKAANAEGNLRIAWAATNFSGAKGAKKAEAGMNKYYGTNIKIKYTPGRSFNANSVKLLEEQKAGRKAFVDVVLGGTGQVSFYVKNKIMIPVDWASLMPQVPKSIQAKIISPDRGIVNVVTRVPTIVYNSNLIKAKDAPKSLKDLLDPRWKGKIASTPYAAGFGVLGDSGRFGKAGLMKYAEALADNLGGLMRCSSYDRILSGEFWIFALACQPGNVRKLIEKGAPLAQSLPSDALNIEYYHFGIPKNSINTNAAKLYIAYWLTKPGQKLLFDVMYDDLHYLKGSQTAKLIAKVRMESGGAKIFDEDISYLLAQTQNLKYQRAVAKIFRATRKKKK